MVVVAAGIIWDQDRFLISQRKKDTHQALKWEFPGGKLEEGESPEQCLHREIREELGISIQIEDIYEVVYYRYPSLTILLLAYRCKYSGGDIHPMECEAYQWIRAEEIVNYEFAPADKPILEKLLQDTAFFP